MRLAGRHIVFFFLLQFLCLLLGFSVLPPEPVGAVVLSLFLSVFLAGLIFLLVRDYILKPVHRLLLSVDRMIRGEAPDWPGVTRPDEVGALARGLSDLEGHVGRVVAEALRERDEARAVLSSMGEAVLVIGRDGTLLHMSAAAQKVLDLRTPQPVGRNYWEAVRHEEINRLIRRAFASSRPVDGDIAIYAPQEMFFHAQASPVSGPDGEVKSVVAIFHDISDIKKFERMRSEFVANVSHELKTPLTSIKGYVETLKDGAVDDPQEARRFLSIIERQTGQLESLVTDILTLSAIEARDPQGRGDEEVDLGGVVAEVIEAQQKAAEARGHRLALRLPPGGVRIRGDHRALGQVFTNLLDNAIKFTPCGGQISVDVREEGGMVRADVRDSGIGIPPEHLPRIFERFYRVDRARSREMGGTGLGLAIVKHLVQSHGGRVAVESVPGQGAVFSVFLPRMER
ncbi:MAG: PAS domain-containing protein [Elusimicrobia bacterium]|nr:PAS domain-containing protein [Elusimicrobiota bacterium]